MNRRPIPTARHLFLLSLLVGPVLGEERCVPTQPADNDWHWYEADHLIGACSFKTGCKGTYVEPVREWPDADLPPRDAPLRANADRTMVEGAAVELEGDVELRKGQLGLHAGRIYYNRDAQQFSLSGGATISLPGLLIEGEAASLSGADGTGRIEQARFLAFDSGVRASAALIERDSPDSLHLEEAVYTQCPPTAETWALKSEDISLDFASGRGVARDSTVRVAGVPVFYTPWLDFPIDDRRATGLLWPGFASSGGGLDISVPYYLNLAPNYDLTLIPRFVEQRGEMLESEARYLNHWSEWQLSGAYMGSDREAGRDRWLFGLAQHGAIDANWSTLLDITRVSDDDYFSDLSVASLSVRRSTHLSQRGQLGFHHDRWRSTLTVHQYQTLADLKDPYRKRPQWTLEYLGPVKNLTLQPVLRADITEFDHQDGLENDGLFITGRRSYAEGGLRLPLVGRAGHLITTVKARYLGYALDDGVINRSPEVTAGLASLDAGLVFEHRGETRRQTLEPRLFYLYSDHEPGQNEQPVFDTTLLPFTYQQLFRESRFAGYDRVDDANQLSVGVSSRLIDTTGREILKTGLGQIFYFRDREVALPDTIVEGTTGTDPALLEPGIAIPGVVDLIQPGDDPGGGAADQDTSDVAAQLHWQPVDGHWLRADAVVDRDDGRLNQSHLGWHYRSDGDSLYNFGYSQRRLVVSEPDDRPELEQLDASIVVPVGRQWTVFARWQYSLEDKRSLENLIGLSFESCCWAVRTVYQRALEPDDDKLSKDLDHDEAILLEFQLKGLGGLGDKLTGILEESIFGYRDD